MAAPDAPPPDAPASGKTGAPPTGEAAKGTLFVVPTPIGNLEDITLRALRVLSEVAVVAAEDTRSARVLFDRHGLRTPTLSYFDGNEAERAATLVARLVGGESVAVISEAGMPGISDPGERLVQAAIAAGVRVEVLPGASAAVTALVGSGLPARPHLFLGFPPREAGARRELFGRLRTVAATLVLYESPRRAGETLADLAAAFGEERAACLARELTKIHEEFVRGSLGALARRYGAEDPRGEVVLLVAGAAAEDAVAAPLDVEAEVRRRVALGEGPKDIAAALALTTGLPRRKLYQLALAVAGRAGGAT